MKLTIRILCTLCVLLFVHLSYSQCLSGYNQTKLNWDNREYYYNSAGGNPYGNYVTNAMEQTQKFALGRTDVTFTLSAAGIVKGIDGTQTGDLAGFKGQDVHFVPNANNQSITLTFAVEVMNVSFTLYDIDSSQSFSVSAKNAANTALSPSITIQASTILTVNTTTPTLPTVTAQKNHTPLSMSSNNGSSTITVTGPVKTIVLTVTTIGNNPEFWFSDLYACVPGNTYPVNYQKMPGAKPFTGQPDYFLVTPNNRYVYQVDPATGKSVQVYKEGTYMNSLAYDAINHFLYYVTDAGISPRSKSLKKYDFNTSTVSTLITDLSASPYNIPLLDLGVESAGASFYDSCLYIGIEGNLTSSSGSIQRKSVIWRINFDASHNPVSACQVWGVDAYTTSGSSNHDWGDFTIKDGILYDFNSNPNNLAASDIKHVDLFSDTLLKQYINPNPAQVYSGQTGLCWNGDVYSFWDNATAGGDGLMKYNFDGTLNPTIGFTVVRGAGWPGGAGDASDNFKPAMDFGDAPASYDPVTADPAVAETDSTLHIGANVDREFTTRGQTATATSDNYDDGVATISVFNTGTNTYLLSVDVYNHTGSNATVIGWLDENGNGTFESNEASNPITVSSSTSMQTISLFWPNTNNSTLPSSTSTFVRLRITTEANNMTSANPTGYFDLGEVEDYRVDVSTYPLAVMLNDFTARFVSERAVEIQWSLLDDTGINYYVIERSHDGKTWELLNKITANISESARNYNYTDNNALPGISYYRMEIMNKNGNMKVSDVKKVDSRFDRFKISISPNPAKEYANVSIDSKIDLGEAELIIVNSLGTQIQKQSILVRKGTNVIYLPDLRNLPSGSYNILLRTKSNTYTQQLVINK